MKGIVLAGGTGSRLFPVTMGVSKQLLPIHDKPMIYYPISVLMLAGVRDVLVITTPNDQSSFQRLLGDGGQFGIKISYAEQAQPRGIADAILIAEQFINNQPICLVLGDNIFYGHGFTGLLQKSRVNHSIGATVFCCFVKNAEQFGVVEFDEFGSIVSIQEKPAVPKSNFAVTGLYFFDDKVVEIAKTLTPSERGEFEITDVLGKYLGLGELNAAILGRGIAWLDTGTHESMAEAGQFVSAVEKRQGLKIACLEEIGLSKGWLEKEDLTKRANIMKNTEYGRYLQDLVEKHESR